MNSSQPVKNNNVGREEQRIQGKICDYFGHQLWTDFQVEFEHQFLARFSQQSNEEKELTRYAFSNYTNRPYYEEEEEDNMMVTTTMTMIRPRRSK